MPEIPFPRLRPYALRAALVFCTLLLFVLPVLAHGGGTPQLTNEPVGPYLLSTWTAPNPPVAGEQLHLTLSLAGAESGAPVTGASVTVTAHQHDADETTLTASATHEGALTPEFYEADLELPRAGDWQLEVSVDGVDGSGQASFTLTVEADATNWLLIAVIGLVSLVVLWIGYLLLRGRRRSPRPSPAS